MGNELDRINSGNEPVLTFDDPHLNNIFSEIDTLEDEEIETTERVEKDDETTREFFTENNEPQVKDNAAEVEESSSLKVETIKEDEKHSEQNMEVLKIEESKEVAETEVEELDSLRGRILSQKKSYKVCH